MSTDTPAAVIVTPIQFIPGALSVQAPAQFSSATQQVNFSLTAQAGQTMIVNLIPQTQGLGTEGTVVFPTNQMTGGPGGVIMNQVLQQSGEYVIRAGQHQMASNLDQGDFLVEVILLPSALND